MRKKLAITGALALVAGSAVVGLTATSASAADGAYQPGAACQITIAAPFTGQLVSGAGEVDFTGTWCYPLPGVNLPILVGEAGGTVLACGTNDIGVLVITCPPRS